MNNFSCYVKTCRHWTESYKCKAYETIITFGEGSAATMCDSFECKACDNRLCKGCEE